MGGMTLNCGLTEDEFRRRLFEVWHAPSPPLRISIRAHERALERLELLKALASVTRRWMVARERIRASSPGLWDVVSADLHAVEDALTGILAALDALDRGRR